MADTCRPATSLPLPISSLGGLGLLSRCNPVSSPSCERPPILFLPHVKCSVSDVVPTNPNTSYTARYEICCSGRRLTNWSLQLERGGERCPRWSHKRIEEKKTQLLTGGCVSNQGSQSGAVRKATVGSDQPRLTQASELSRFPDFGCAQCSVSPAPPAHKCPQAHRMRAAGTSASSGTPHSG